MTTAPIAGGQSVRGLPYYLPLAYVPIKFTGVAATEKDGYQVKAEIQPTTYAADPTAPRFIAYQHSGWSDDQFSLGVDPNGLLQSTSATSSDQTKGVALKIAELIGQIAAAASGFGGGGVGAVSNFRAVRPVNAPAPARCSLPTFTKTFLFDPSATAPSSESFSTDGSQTVTVTVAPVPEAGPLDLNALPQPGPAVARPEPVGVAFRRARPYRYRITIHLSEAARSACKLRDEVSEQVVTVPDRSPGGVFWEDTSRGALVTKTVKLSVTNGMLTSIDVNEPSEILAAVTLPSDLLKALLSIPASVLTFKVQQIGAQQGLTDAESKLLQSKLDLLQKQATLQQPATQQ